MISIGIMGKNTAHDHMGHNIIAQCIWNIQIVIVE